MVLSKDFKEFIESLNANNVKYLIVGGFAVAFHGHPRYTKDLDIWLWIDPENAERSLKALKDFGFGSLGIVKDDLLNPETILQLGLPPNRIDLIASLEGLDFMECYAHRETIEQAGLVLNVLDFPRLIISKRNAGRLQDLADIQALELLKKRSEEHDKGNIGD